MNPTIPLFLSISWFLSVKEAPNAFIDKSLTDDLETLKKAVELKQKKKIK